MKNRKVLVVVAHPDDEVLGCGGTIARLVEREYKVHVAILGGITTSREGKVLTKETVKEADNASAVLGVKSLAKFDLDDNRFDTYPLLEIVKKIELLKEKVNPGIIFTHDHSDLNIDHRITHQAIMTAFRPGLEEGGFLLVAFETPSSTEWQDQEVGSFRPNFYVDIAGTIKKKLQAMQCYKSELRKYPHPRSIEGIMNLARRRGNEVCIEVAEAFRIIRGVI